MNVRIHRPPPPAPRRRPIVPLVATTPPDPARAAVLAARERHAADETSARRQVVKRLKTPGTPAGRRKDEGASSRPSVAEIAPESHTEPRAATPPAPILPAPILAVGGPEPAPTVPPPSFPRCPDRAVAGTDCRGKWTSGDRFGLDYRLCTAHYKRRARAAERAAAPVAPCTSCGTTGGHVREGYRRPSRFRSVKDGVIHNRCHSCRWMGIAAAEPMSPSTGGSPPTTTEIALATAAIHAKNAEKGEKAEKKRYEAIALRSAKPSDAEVARAAIREGRGAEKARREWAKPGVIALPVWEPPDGEDGPAPAKKVNRGPGAHWAKRRFQEPTERFEQ